MQNIFSHGLALPIGSIKRGRKVSLLWINIGRRYELLRSSIETIHEIYSFFSYGTTYNFT